MTKGKTLSQETIGLINVQRRRHDLPPVKPSKMLRLSARVMALKLYRTHTFAHGQKIGNAREWHRFVWLGECLALGQRSVAQCVRDWMDSDDHRAILLSPKARRMAVSVAGRDAPRPVWTLHAAAP